LGLLGALREVFDAAGMAKLVEELHCGQREKMATFSAKNTA
jgi:hypothetical protein